MWVGLWVCIWTLSDGACLVFYRETVLRLARLVPPVPLDYLVPLALSALLERLVTVERL